MSLYRPAESSTPPRATDENLRKAAHAGGNWFFWIAALTLLNEVSIRMGKQGFLTLGLAISQITGILTHQAGGVAGWVGIAMTLALCGAFVLFGVYARRGESWAYGVGMFIYTADSVIYAWFGDWVALGLHALPLLFLLVSWNAWRELRRREATAASLDPAAVPKEP